MLARRIIPCLDVKGGRVVKGTRFVNLRDAGDPVEVAALYDVQGADELVFLDITASHERRGTMIEVVERTAAQAFMPLTVGGGIRRLDDIRDLLKAGADKVSLNTAAVEEPELIRAAAERFGSQCIVLAIDAKRSAECRVPGAETGPGSAECRVPRAETNLGRAEGREPRAEKADEAGSLRSAAETVPSPRERGEGQGEGRHPAPGTRHFSEGTRHPAPGTRHSWEVYTHGGRTPTGKDALAWAREGERLGAGEILLTSMDRDGTKDGYDLALTRAVAEAVGIPVIASGGAGTLAHLYEGLVEGRADAVLAASMFHYREATVAEVKEYLAGRGVPVRM